MPETLQQTFGRAATAAMSSLPRSRGRRRDVGVAAVVEDEPRAGAGVDQLRRVAQLAGPHAEVEAQAELAEQPDAPDERRLQAVAGGRARAVEHLAEPLDRGLLGSGRM